MTAIFKRELKSYLTSMVGYLFIFFVLVLTGIYFSAYQLSGGYSKFETTLSALTFVFLIGVPILSMRVLAEERKQKTDQLLLTAPVSVWDIVFGKYLALVAVFAIPVVIMCVYPLIMSKFGTISYASAFTDLHVNCSGIRTSDRGDRDHHLYHDQKCPDLCSDRSCGRDCPCDRIRCKIQYFPGWYPEGTERI